MRKNEKVLGLNNNDYNSYIKLKRELDELSDNKIKNIIENLLMELDVFDYVEKSVDQYRIDLGIIHSHVRNYANKCKEIYDDKMNQLSLKFKINFERKEEATNNKIKTKEIVKSNNNNNNNIVIMNNNFKLKDNSCYIYSKNKIEDSDYNYYIIKNEIKGKDIGIYFFVYRNLTFKKLQLGKKIFLQCKNLSDIDIKKIFITEIKDFDYDVVLLFQGNVELLNDRNILNGFNFEGKLTRVFQSNNESEIKMKSNDLVDIVDIDIPLLNNIFNIKEK